MRTLFNQFNVDDYDMTLFSQLIASGWEDTSWRNDACPSVEINSGKSRFRIWIGDQDPGIRESEGYVALYSICRVNIEKEELEQPLWEGDSVASLRTQLAVMALPY